jgi:acyl-CoA synthetase (AMP-forming)/AMP-acid ligase II
MARPLLDALAEDSSRYNVSSLFVFASGGAVLSTSTKAQIGALLPNVITVDGFGSTETGVSGSRTRMPGAEVEEGTRFTLDDHCAVLADDLRPIAPGSGVVGQLARRGRVPIGYYKDPAKSATTFVQVDGVRWALTGDAATVDNDGTIVLLGRGSMSINSGGEKVYPEEVEAIVKNHPSVYDAVVVGTPHERWGEQVVVVLAPRPGAAVTLDEVREHCRGFLAGYKLPRELCIVDAIVRGPNGKADYRWARERALESVE